MSESSCQSQEHRVSVVIALYNGYSFIQEELTTILPQLSPGDEVLIMDDGSTDGGRELCRSLARIYPQIRVIQNEHAGVVRNFERGIEQATGSVIFLADQDDLWENDKVSTVMGTLERVNGPALVLHDAEFVDGSNVSLGQSLFHWRGISERKTGFAANWWKNGFMGCCMAFTKDLKPYLLPMPKNIPMHDQWIGMMANHYGKVFLIHKKLIRYRRHENTTTKDQHRSLISMLGSRTGLLIDYIKQVMKQRRRKSK